MPNLTWLYAGAIYAAAVALGRRAGADLPKRVAFFFFALVLLFFREPLTTDTINEGVKVTWATVDRFSFTSDGVKFVFDRRAS